MRRIVEFTVHGRPVPQGSSRAFVPKGWTRPVITSANKSLKPWRKEISETAAFEMNGREMFSKGVPVRATLTFYFRKPSGVKKAQQFKTTAPDLDKLTRAFLDGLTGIVFHDDGQVAEVRASKMFDDNERVEARIEQIEE